MHGFVCHTVQILERHVETHFAYAMLVIIAQKAVTVDKLHQIGSLSAFLLHKPLCH